MQKVQRIPWCVQYNLRSTTGEQNAHVRLPLVSEVFASPGKGLPQYEHLASQLEFEFEFVAHARMMSVSCFKTGMETTVLGAHADR
jgi:hypothetical protein